MISYILQLITFCMRLALVPVILLSIMIIATGAIILGISASIIYAIDKLDKETI